MKSWGKIGKDSTFFFLKDTRNRWWRNLWSCVLWNLGQILYLLAFWFRTNLGHFAAVNQSWKRSKSPRGLRRCAWGTAIWSWPQAVTERKWWNMMNHPQTNIAPLMKFPKSGWCTVFRFRGNVLVQVRQASDMLYKLQTWNLYQSCSIKPGHHSQYRIILETRAEQPYRH